MVNTADSTRYCTTHPPSRRRVFPTNKFLCNSRARFSDHQSNHFTPRWIKRNSNISFRNSMSIQAVLSLISRIIVDICPYHQIDLEPSSRCLSSWAMNTALRPEIVRASRSIVDAQAQISEKMPPFTTPGRVRKQRLT